MRCVIAWVISLSAAMSSGVAMAATYPLDDRASVPYNSVTRMDWDSLTARRGSVSTLSGRMSVQVRLDTHPWQHRVGHIYMKLQGASLNSNLVSAEWTTHGRLLSGTLRPGERALVYSGPIEASTIEDWLALTVRTESRGLTQAQQLDFSFEIDVN